eukprot:gene3814-6324_t
MAEVVALVAGFLFFQTVMTAITERLKDELAGRSPDEITSLNLDNCVCGKSLAGIITDKFVNLRYLSLSAISLNSLHGFPTLPALEKLLLTDNRLSKGFEKLAVCTNLRYIDLGGNKIRSLDVLAPLSSLPNLERIIVMNNPASDESDYREKVFQLLPNVTYVDSMDREGNENLTEDEDDEEEDDDNEDDDEENGEVEAAGDYDDSDEDAAGSRNDDDDDDGDGNGNGDDLELGSVVDDDDGGGEYDDGDDDDDDGDDDDGDGDGDGDGDDGNDDDDDDGDYDDDDDDGPGLEHLLQEDIGDDDDDGGDFEVGDDFDDEEDDYEEDDDDDAENESKRPKTG